MARNIMSVAMDQKRGNYPLNGPTQLTICRIQLYSTIQFGGREEFLCAPEAPSQLATKRSYPSLGSSWSARPSQVSQKTKFVRF